MNDWIGNIFYFGSPKDGFKVYPDLGAIANVFEGYSSNTETDWILVARKSEDRTRYTYVRYGLLTAAVDGRTGSYFGISIDFLNHYFTDLKVFQTEIFENIWRAILSDGKLLETQASSGKVAFKSYDLRDVASYLDEMSKKIREVIKDKKWSNYIRPAYEIPQANDVAFEGLHPDSSPSAISEYFKLYGAIKLSPKLPIETKSLSEKQQETREKLERKVDELTERLGQKDRELQTVSQKLEKLQTSLNAIAMEFSPARNTNQNYEPRPSANHTGQYPVNTSYRPSHQRYPRNTMILAIIAVIFVSAALVLLVMALTSSEPTTPLAGSTQTSLPLSQPTASVATPEAITIVRRNNTEFAILNKEVFFQQVNGRTMFDEGDLKEALSTFLFQFSPEVRSFYGNDKDKLWKQVLESNPTSKRYLTEYLRHGPFRIDGNPVQQAILEELIIFKKPL